VEGLCRNGREGRRSQLHCKRTPQLLLAFGQRREYVGYTILTTATALAVTEVHDALLAVDTQADQVIECVIESEEEEIIDAGDGSATDIIDTGDAYLEVPRHAGPFLRRLMQYGG
jgi:hypothetical protein